MARIEHSIEVNVPVGTVYNQLTQFEEYPRFMEDVEEVRQLDDTHLHWHTRAGNLDMQWDTEITQQVPDRCIAWRNITEPGYEGKIELHPIGEGRTKVTLTVEGEPRQQIAAESTIAQRTEHDLARFKEFMERLGSETGAWRGRVSDAQPIPPQGTAQSTQDAQAESGKQQKQDDEQEKQGEKWTTRPPWMPNFLQVWDEPLNMMRRMSEDMDNLLDRFIGGPLAGARPRPSARQQPSDAPAPAWTPPVEIAQRDDRFVVCAELAGVKREDVRVEIKNDRLTIEGDRRREPPHAPQEQRRSERSYGHFYRAIELPPGADTDAASASMHDGILEITVPVHGNASQGRKIEIQSLR